MDAYINNAMLANDKSLKLYTGGSSMLPMQQIGGAKPAKPRSDKRLLNKVIDFNRRAVLDMERPEPLVGIETAVDRYKFERKFSDFTNELTSKIEEYLTGTFEKDTGDLIKKYNDLILYIKNILNWRNLSETEKGIITVKFDDILPQITQLLDIVMTEKKVDKKVIEKLYNNILTRNYIEIPITNYEKKISEKKPSYTKQKRYERDLETILNKIYFTVQAGDIYYDDITKDLIKRVKVTQKEYNNLLKKLVKEYTPTKKLRIEQQLELLGADIENFELELFDLRAYKEQKDKEEKKDKAIEGEMKEEAEIGIEGVSKEVQDLINSIDDDDLYREVRLVLNNYIRQNRGRSITKLQYKSIVSEAKKNLTMRGKGMKGKGIITKSMIERPSQPLYDRIEQLNTDKFYGYGDFKIAKKIINNFNPFGNEIKPMPINFINHFDKIIKDSKKMNN